ncbi:DinB family protein [Virgibacillus sp. SK37]|uniref:DinB family protein n=1 Tax=Virgibacillus sp. SK37 TaxID=403957 RepID=UPI0004D15316|nr:DinB family protein [Virgibacillus sp. SK37]AIF44356.1 hypothetical protein X953_15260 [Virgibacillus sp. SK37]
MSKSLLKQFAFTRDSLIKEINKIDPEIADVQLDGYNNTIHWQIGHILTVAEQFLFGFPQKAQHLPGNYVELFGNGTKPADWQGEVPSVDKLTNELQEQVKRVMEIPEEQFNVKLEKPFLGQETFGGLTTLATYHEAQHTGQIHALRLLAEHTK